MLENPFPEKGNNQSNGMQERRGTFVQESTNLSHEVAISQPHNSRGGQIEPEDQETHWDPMELLLFLFMTLLLLMFPFHDGCMLEWNCINYQSVRNHWKEYTHHLSLFDTCLVSLDSPSFGNFFAHQRVHQITAGKAGTVQPESS